MDALPSASLPPGWTTAKLGDLGAWTGGGTPSKSRDEFWTAGTVPWVSPKDMKSARVGADAERITEAAVAQSAAKLVPAGSVLCVVRSGILQHTFPVAIAEQDVTLNQDMRALTPAGGICAEYVRHYLRYRNDDILYTCSKDGTTVASIEQPRLHEFPVPLAPEREQTRIVAAVNALFEEVEAGEAALARAREGLTQFRASLLHAACTGALSNTRDAPWEIKPLAELISEGPKNGFSPKAGDNENGTLALKLTATTSGRLNLAPHAVKRLSETIAPGSSLFLRPGDLLFQRGNTREYVGIAAVYDGPLETYVYPDLMIRVRTLDPAITTWIWRVANAPMGRQHMQNAASGTAGSMPKITGDAVRSLPIPVPPHGEMLRLLERVSEELATADDAEAALDAQQAAATALRQSILHAAFTGRLVPQDPADEPAAALLARLRAAPTATRRPSQRRAAAQPDLIETPA